MKVELTEAQIEEIGKQWLSKKLQYEAESIIKLVFKELRFSKFTAWDDMLVLAVKTCAKEYLVKPSDVLTLVKDGLTKSKEKGTK